MLRRGFAGFAAALVLVSGAGAFGPGRFGLMPTIGPVAVVEGGLIGCTQGGSAHPQYSAGTVGIRHAGLDPFFFGPFAVQHVEANGVYRFVVEPGRYVVTSKYGVAYFNLEAGDDIQVNIKEPCIPPPS